MDAPEPGGMQDVLNPVSTEYDSNNLMINGDDDEVDDDGDDDDDKDYDYKAEMGPAHQGPQGEPFYCSYAMHDTAWQLQI